jgi:hypothetical protein
MAPVAALAPIPPQAVLPTAMPELQQGQLSHIMNFPGGGLPPGMSMPGHPALAGLAAPPGFTFATGPPGSPHPTMVSLPGGGAVAVSYPSTVMAGQPIISLAPQMSMMAARPAGPALLPGGMTAVPAGHHPPPGIPVSMAGIPVSSMGGLPPGFPGMQGFPQSFQGGQLLPAGYPFHQPGAGGHQQHQQLTGIPTAAGMLMGQPHQLFGGARPQLLGLPTQQALLQHPGGIQHPGGHPQFIIQGGQPGAGGLAQAPGGFAGGQPGGTQFTMTPAGLIAHQPGGFLPQGAHLAFPGIPGIPRFR